MYAIALLICLLCGIFPNVAKEIIHSHNNLVKDDKLGTPLLYPVSASWMKDRYTVNEWRDTLNRFRKQGGTTVWQRGRPFRKRDRGDMLRDPDYAWCYVNGQSCFDVITQKVSAKGATIANFIAYDYDENYSDMIMQCPDLDFSINTSRIYHVVVLPRYNITEGSLTQLQCRINKGDEVDVVIVQFEGIDSKEILLQEASQIVGKDSMPMQVYLGMPGLPPRDDAPWDVDEDLLSSFLEWTKRVFLDYTHRYSNNPKLTNSFAGVYQSMEISLAKNPPPNLMASYSLINQVLRKFLPKKKYVVSPYVDVNLSQINNTVEDHKKNFMTLASSGVDVIAIQEGRGVAKAAYYWPYQEQTQIGEVDPFLLRIVRYLDPKVPKDVTYSEQFTASTRMLFKAFYEAQQEMANVTSFQLWANLEAFEYLRDQPCLPVDPMGNGMAELLDRTYKARIDWGLTFQGAYVNDIISFAWDSCYLCLQGGYTKSLADEILEDWDRPIASDAFLDANNTTLMVLGFNLDKTKYYSVEYTTADGINHMSNITSFSVNANYGKENQKSPLLQLASLHFKLLDLKSNYYIKILPVTSNKEAYHSLAMYY